VIDVFSRKNRGCCSRRRVTCVIARNFVQAESSGGEACLAALLQLLDIVIHARQTV
jgi:hypothetical protein